MSKFFKSEGQDVEHMLPYSWNVWHHIRNYGEPEASEMGQEGESAVENTQDENNEDSTATKENDLNQYLKSTEQISFPKFSKAEESTKLISSLEQLLIAVSNLISAGDLEEGEEILVFKDGVKPIWEDPINEIGGKFFFKLRNSPSQKSFISNFWDSLVLSTCGGSLVKGDASFKQLCDEDICGLVLSIRKKDVSISIWNTNLNLEKFKSLIQPGVAWDDGSLGTELDVQAENEPREKNEEPCRRLIDNSISRLISDTLKNCEIEDLLHPKVFFREYRLHRKRSEKWVTRDNNGTNSHSNHSNYNSRHGGRYHDRGNGNYHRSQNGRRSYNNHHSDGHKNGRQGNSVDQHEIGEDGSVNAANAHYHGNNNNRHHHHHNSNRGEFHNSRGKNRNSNRDSSSAGNGQGDGLKTEVAQQFVFSNLGRRRRGLDNSVDGGEPSGLLFESRRRLQQLQQEQLNEGLI